MRTAVVLGAMLAAALTAPPAAADQGPSFDCARATGAAQTLVCGDPALAALDRELARLYALAVSGPQMTDDRRATLRAEQRGWIKGRDDCWKAVDLRACVRFAYASDIHEMRQGYAAARAADDAGLSRGPFPVTCDGIVGVPSVSVTAGPAPLAYIAWGDHAHVLPAAPAASGARYGDDALGFWSKGADATLTRDGAVFHCRNDVRD